MPLLTPSAMEVSASLSRTARHMAHCACDVVNTNNKIEKSAILTRFLSIIWRNHQIDNHTCYGDIKPNWKGDFCDFFMSFKIISYGSNIGY